MHFLFVSGSIVNQNEYVNRELCFLGTYKYRYGIELEDKCWKDHLHFTRRELKSERLHCCFKFTQVTGGRDGSGH